MGAAKRRAIDALRRDRMLARKHAEIGRDLADERDTSAENSKMVVIHICGFMHKSMRQNEKLLQNRLCMT